MLQRNLISSPCNNCAIRRQRATDCSSTCAVRIIVVQGCLSETAMEEASIEASLGEGWGSPNARLFLFLAMTAKFHAQDTQTAQTPSAQNPCAQDFFHAIFHWRDIPSTHHPICVTLQTRVSTATFVTKDTVLIK